MTAIFDTARCGWSSLGGFKDLSAWACDGRAGMAWAVVWIGMPGAFWTSFRERAGLTDTRVSDGGEEEGRAGGTGGGGTNISYLLPSFLPYCVLCSLLLWDFALHLCCGIVRYTTTTTTADEYGKSTEGRLIGGTSADAVLLT